MVVFGLVFEWSTRAHEDRFFEINIHRAKIWIATRESQRLNAIAEVGQQYELLGIVILRIRGLEALCGNIVIERR